MRQDLPDSGWSLVAERDEAAKLIEALVDLDGNREYTRSELADAAGVALKTLYLDDTIGDLVDAGMLDRVDDEDEDTEARFVLNRDSDGLAAARQFDRALAANLDVEAE